MRCCMSNLKDRIGELAVGKIHHIRHKHVILLDDEVMGTSCQKKTKSFLFFFRKESNKSGNETISRFQRV